VLGVSEWFACRVTGQHRATQRHEPSSTTAEDPDAALRAWLRTYAEDHPRRGFRPAYHDARAEGWIVNHKKIHRLWREEGLRVPQRRRDNGPELACSAMADWAAGQVGLHFVPPGEPWRNGYVESFNSRIPDECLNIKQLLVAGPRPSDHQRLETRLQPPSPTFRPRLPTTEPLRCHLHSSMCVGMRPVG
jgi:transposase InsO family protein